MRIRLFEKGDEFRFKPNEFSNIDGLNLDDAALVKYTLEDNDSVKCILCWREYAPKHYAIFFLMPDDVGFRHARALKRFLDKIIIELEPESCITYSRDCAKLNRWHKFFGFTQHEKNHYDAELSGIIDLKHYNKWLILWDR